MTKRLWERWLPFVTFVAVFCCHPLYLRHLSLAAEGWADVAVGEGTALGFAAYLQGQDYYLGFSYALSAGFVTWSLVNYLSRRRVVMAAGAVGGVTVVGVLMGAGCFLTGCCGSPMLGIYVSLFGMKAAGVAKPLIAAMTALSIGGSYWYLSRSYSRSCTDSRCSCQIQTRKEI